MTHYSGIERRSGEDRRQYPRPSLRGLFYRGMRETARREEDRRRIVTFDRYQPTLLIAVGLVLALSLLDALLTLVLISQGASELNPVMHYCLSHGPEIFLVVKYGLTALSVMIIVIAKEPITVRYRSSTGILHLFAAVFGAVVIWEFYLLTV